MNKIPKAFNTALTDFKFKNIFWSWKFWFFIYAFVRFVITLTHHAGVDTRIYLDALNRAALHGNDAAFFAGTGFVYTPFALLFFKPLYFLHNQKLAHIIMAFISLVCLYLIYKQIFAFFKLFPNKNLAIFLLTLSIVDRFITFNINIGQVNLIYFLLILISFFASLNKKYIKSAFFLCFSMCFKLTPIVFLPYFFIKKQYRIVFLSGTFFVFLNVLASLLLGGSEYLKILIAYFNTLHDSSQIMALRSDNVAFLTLLSRMFQFYQIPINFLPKLIWFVSFIATYFTFLFWTYNNRRFDSSYDLKSKLNTLDLSLLLGFMLVFSPITWLHYLVMLIFPLTLISISLIEQYRNKKILTGTAVFYLFLLLNSSGSFYVIFPYLRFAGNFLPTFTILNLSIFVYIFWKRCQLFIDSKKSKACIF